MTEASTQVGDALLASMASASSAAYQHQMYAAAALGRARGVTQRHAPAVVYDDMQGLQSGFSLSVMTSPCETCPGLRGSGLSHSHRVAVPSLTQSRKRATGFLPLVVRAYSRSAGSNRARDLSVASRVSSTARLNTLADQQSVNSFADLPHVLALSKASLRPTHIGRSEKEWRYLISVMRCPK